MAEPHTYTVTEGPPCLIRDRASVPDDADVQEALEENRSLLLNDHLLRTLHCYFETGSLDDLSEIVEVVYGICHDRGFTPNELQELVKVKRDQWGGFESCRMLLTGPVPTDGGT